MPDRASKETCEHVVRRLAALRDDGVLTTRDVAFNAEHVLGVSERHLWRWLARGTTETTPRKGFVLSRDEEVAFFEANGSITRAYELLRGRGVTRCSLRTFQRAIGQSFNPSERAYARKGERARRDLLVRMEIALPARNAVWQADHVELPIYVTPPIGRIPIKPWATFMVDCGTRGITGFALNLRQTQADVLVAIRHGVLPDPRYGPFHGVPGVLVWDNGMEFLAESVTQVAGKLGCAVKPTDAYAPEQKPVIERLNRTIQDELLSTLPFYADGPRNRAGKLYGSEQARLSYGELCERVYAWVTHYNLQRPHSRLDGRTPAKAWEDDVAPLRTIDPAAARCITTPSKQVKVTTKGVRANSRHYVWPGADDLTGTEVEVFYMPHDQRSIDVYQAGRFVAAASPSDSLTPEETKAILAARQASKQKASDLRRSASRNQRVRFASMNSAAEPEPVTMLDKNAETVRELIMSKRPANTRGTVTHPAQVNQPWAEEERQP